jgi:hypothetical protein
VLTRPTDAFAGFCGELRVGWLILDTRDPEAKGALDPGDFCSTSGRRRGPAAISSPSLREQRGPDLGVSSDLGRSGANWPRVVRSGPIWGQLLLRQLGKVERANERRPGRPRGLHNVEARVGAEPQRPSTT